MEAPAQAIRVVILEGGEILCNGFGCLNSGESSNNKKRRMQSNPKPTGTKQRIPSYAWGVSSMAR